VAGQHAIHRAAQAVDVGAVIDGVRADLLGRHVVGGADEVAGAGDLAQLGPLAQLGQAEVQHLGVLLVAAADAHDVLGLQIPMHHPRVVGLVQGRADLHAQGDGPRHRQGPLALDDRAQVVALDVLHDQVEQPLPRAEVEGLDDVGVVEPAHHLHLAAEALDDLVLLGQLSVQDLHRRDLPHPHVLDPVDGAHAAGAHPGLDAVAAVDDLPDPGVRALIGAGPVHLGAAVAAIARYDGIVLAMATRAGQHRPGMLTRRRTSGEGRARCALAHSMCGPTYRLSCCSWPGEVRPFQIYP
jgi:hypothetical protein